MLGQVNHIAGFGGNLTFQAWMLLSLLQLPPRKWSDLLQDLNHRSSGNREEHKICRPNVPGVGGHCLVDEDPDPRPLSMYLDDLDGTSTVGTPKYLAAVGVGEEGVIDGSFLADDSDSDCSSDEGQDEHEEVHDPISLDELQVAGSVSSRGSWYLLGNA